MRAPPDFLLRSRWSERWASSIWRRLARWTLPRYSVHSRFDRLILVDLEDNVSRAMLTRGLWEREQLATLHAEAQARRRPGQPSVFLDIGSYWGLYTLYAERHGFADRYHAFEADPRNRLLLQMHLRMNALEDRVTLHGCAVSDQAGETTLTGHGGIARMGKGTITVPMARLDDLVEVTDSFVIAKIDVEGAEAAVLDGMTRTLTQNRVLLQIETFPEQRDAVFARLAALGLERIAAIGRDEYYFATPEQP